MQEHVYTGLHDMQGLFTQARKKGQRICIFTPAAACYKCRTGAKPMHVAHAVMRQAMVNAARPEAAAPPSPGAAPAVQTRLQQDLPRKLSCPQNGKQLPPLPSYKLESQRSKSAASDLMHNKSALPRCQHVTSLPFQQALRPMRRNIPGSAAQTACEAQLSRRKPRPALGCRLQQALPLALRHLGLRQHAPRSIRIHIKFARPLAPQHPWQRQPKPRRPETGIGCNLGCSWLCRWRRSVLGRGCRGGRPAMT